MLIEYAGFWRRFAALIIDCCIVCFALYLVYFSLLHFLNCICDFPNPKEIKQFRIDHPFYSSIPDTMQLLGVAAYIVFFISSRYQATLGQRIMGVYVATENGARLKLAKGLGRYAIAIAPLLLLHVFISLIYPEISKEMQHIKAIQDDPRIVTIGDNIDHHRSISKEDKTFLDDSYKQMMVGIESPIMITLFIVIAFIPLYALMQAGMIIFTREKTAIQDVVCKTRALIGRT